MPYDGETAKRLQGIEEQRALLGRKLRSQRVWKSMLPEDDPEHFEIDRLIDAFTIQLEELNEEEKTIRDKAWTPRDAAAAVRLRT